jgi:hypothetical protein
MHRSGSSLVARVLKECGVYLGPEEDLLPAAPENRDGFWEHAGLTELNDEILAALGGSWDEPPPLPDGWEEQLGAFEERAGKLVAPLREHEPWGWKDPRNSLTLPFWRRVLGDELIVVECLRDPAAIAASLVKRNGMTRERAEDLCRTYAGALESETRVEVRYESLLADPETEVTRLAEVLSLGPTQLQLARAVESVNPGLQHHGDFSAGGEASAIDPETRLEASRGLLEETRSRLYAVQDELAAAEERIAVMHERARETDRRHRAEIGALKEELARVTGHVDELLRELEWMKSTRVWRTATSWWKFKDRLRGRRHAVG